MTCLNTNVATEAIKAQWTPAMLAWNAEQEAETLYLSRSARADMMLGFSALHVGLRKDALTQMMEGMLDLFGDWVLAFNADAARSYSKLTVSGRTQGKNLFKEDGAIAANARVHGFVVKPWEAMS